MLGWTPLSADRCLLAMRQSPPRVRGWQRLGRGCRDTLPSGSCRRQRVLVACVASQVCYAGLRVACVTTRRIAAQVGALARLVGSASSRGSNDRVGASHPIGYHITVGDVFSLATLALTFFAGFVALLAYQSSTGSPDLRLGIMFYDDDEEEPDEEKPYRYDMYYQTSDERWAKLQAWFESHNDHIRMCS